MPNNRNTATVIVIGGILSFIVIKSFNKLFNKNTKKIQKKRKYIPSNDIYNIKEYTLEKDDEQTSYSSSEEELINYKMVNISRSGHSVETNEVKKQTKMSHMKKEQLIEECEKNGLSIDGTVRILRSRLKKYTSK
jgi:Tfp pilus assembly protein PilE